MPRPSRIAFLLFACVLCAGLLNSQTIVVGQPQLTFAAAQGTNSTVQVLPIQLTGGVSIPYMVSFTPSTGSNWLYFSPSFGQLPANVLFLASATNLAAGTYTGMITITAPQATNSPLNVPVTFSVGQSIIDTTTVSPSALTFTARVNSNAPPAQLVQVHIDNSPYTFYVTALASAGGGWLQVTPTSGTAPTQLSVTVSPQGLSPGYYFGTITVTPSIGRQVVMPVTLVVTSTTTLNLSSSNFQFYFQTGTANPAPQILQIGADFATPIPFSLAPSTLQGNWLRVTPLAGSAPQVIAISADPTGLAPGAYVGTITVASGTANVAVENIGVTLTVANTTLLTVGTQPAPFNYTTAGTLPASQSVDIGSTAGPLSFSVTAAGVGGNWLSVGPASGTTPRSLAVGVNPAGLGAGVYSGLVTVTSPGVVNSPQSFPVTLNVNAVQSLTASPVSLIFNYQLGSTTPVPAQSIQVTTALPANVAVTVSSASCGSWLVPIATNMAAPGALAVTVNTTGLTTPRVCTASIFLNVSGVPAVEVPVTLNVSNAALLNITPTTLAFTVDYGGSYYPTQNLALSTTDGTQVSFIASVGLNTAWLQVAPNIANAPTPVQVTINPGLLTPGTYNGQIMFTSPGLVQNQVVPVTLTVRPVTTTTAKPVALSFTQSVGGSTPAPQQVAIGNGNDSFPFTVSVLTTSTVGWLLVTPAQSRSPGSITVSVATAGLPVGSYSGSIMVSVTGASNDPLTIPVSLTVTNATGIGAAPASLSFTYQAGALFTPADQTLTVTSTGAAINFTTSATTSGSSGNWLAVKPSSGLTTGKVTVAVNPSGLTVGTYTGQVVIASTGAVGSPVSIPVTLTVQPQPNPVITSIANAASGATGEMAVGEIVTLKGTGMGPATGLGPSLTSSGRVDTTDAFTRVIFDGWASPILYTSATQINAVVPYELSGRRTVQVQVENQGLRSQAVTMSMISAAPGIFTANSSGTGQASVLNQDSTINSVQNPAAAGSIVQIFATGEGQTSPNGDTGSVAGAVLPKPLLPVTATVGGADAEVLYAGAAPSAVAGLFQVNVRLPDGVTGDAVKVMIKVGDAMSQDKATIAVR